MTVPVIGTTACSNCKHSYRDPSKELSCRRMPPICHPIIAMTNQGPQMIGKVSMYPKVEENWKCGEYARNVVVAVETKVVEKKKDD